MKGRKIMARESKSIISSIRKQAKESGSAKKDFFYLGDGSKGKVRFLIGFEEAAKVVWHNSYNNGVDTPCLEYYGEECPYCNKTKDDGFRTRDMYAWTVWDYDAQRQKIFIYAVSDDYSPLMQILAIYDEFGCVTDRDLIIKRTGTKLNTHYDVINGDTGRSPKCKAWSKDEIFAKIKSSYIDMEEEVIEEAPKKQRGRNRNKPVEQKKTIEEIIKIQPLQILKSIASELGEEIFRNDTADDLIDLILGYKEADVEDVYNEVTGDDIPF